MQPNLFSCLITFTQSPLCYWAWAFKCIINLAPHGSKFSSYSDIVYCHHRRKFQASRFTVPRQKSTRFLVSLCDVCPGKLHWFGHRSTQLSQRLAANPQRVVAEWAAQQSSKTTPRRRRAASCMFILSDQDSRQRKPETRGLWPAKIRILPQKVL